MAKSKQPLHGSTAIKNIVKQAKVEKARRMSYAGDAKKYSAIREYGNGLKEAFNEVLTANDATGKEAAIAEADKIYHPKARVDDTENGADHMPVQQPLDLVVPEKQDTARELRMQVREGKRSQLTQESQAKLEKLRAEREEKARKRKKAMEEKLAFPSVPQENAAPISTAAAKRKSNNAAKPKAAPAPKTGAIRKPRKSNKKISTATPFENLVMRPKAQPKSTSVKKEQRNKAPRTGSSAMTSSLPTVDDVEEEVEFPGLVYRTKPKE
ncbi:uncharacterized protein LY89DRAFT_743198 [Mollisia scopiformis]|uniref:Uncharacterized protein n=1 Tax=Mollisia scopiformis TaxID=149040 RepID=A0A132B456_MOLSC|nr:uncharacterized protein LY89DRAFT_743198 [Mollisia scopiformis]KUJ07198.1 hypothetical protein LY89DRAFT_743198 [Mollisia scopiformis]